MAFRFKDKERPRGYTSKVAGLLHVRPASDSAACFQGDALGLVISVPAVRIGLGAVNISFRGLGSFLKRRQKNCASCTELLVCHCKRH